MNLPMSIAKKREIHFVETAARLLGEDWEPEPRERPDFVISFADSTFALEVTETFIGPVDVKGSVSRRKEQSRTDWLTSIRNEYAGTSAASPIAFKYLGRATDHARSMILSTLHEEDFNAKSVLYNVEKTVPDGKFWATKALRDDWVFLNDRVGWVSDDSKLLQAAINRKKSKLESYRAIHQDVRLLVVADRTANSGKLGVGNDFTPDMGGYDRIYFLSYPLEIRRYS